MDQAHAAGAADRLDADSYANFVTFQRADFFPEICRFFPRAEANFIELLRKFLLHEIEKLLRLGRAGGVLDSSVNVFCVFPKDDHVYFLRMLERRGDAFEVLHRPQAHKKIEKLPQCHVKRANAAADRSGQRTFDADQIFAECFHGIIWQPVIEFVFRRLTGKNLKPGDLLLSAKRFLDRGIEHVFARRPDVRPGAISPNERNDRLIRDTQLSFVDRNLVAGWRCDVCVRHKPSTVAASVTPAMSAVLSRKGRDDDAGGEVRREAASLWVVFAFGRAASIFISRLRAS